MLRELLGLSSHEMSSIGGATFAYLFHRITQDQLVKIIKEIDETKVERVLDVVRKKGYVLRNCKLYAWAFYKSRHGGPKPKPKAFGIHRQDVQFLSRLNLAHIDLKYEAFSLDDYKALIEGATTGPTVDAYIGRFISKRMTFLLRSYNVKRDDLENEMVASAIRAIYMKFPQFESSLHLTNTAKTAIHNSGETLVTYYTSPSRQRLMVNDDGQYEARNVNTEVLIDLEAAPSYLEHARDYLEVLARLGERGMREDVQRFLLCCAGHYDEEFSSFLKMNNAEAIEDMAYSRYLGKARKHFKFSEWQVNKLFEKLRMHLE